MLSFRFPFAGDVIDLWRFVGGSKHSFLLDSSQRGILGRYSFIGVDPFDVDQTNSAGLMRLKKKFYAALPSGRTLPRSSATPLPAGLVGFVSYEAGEPEGIPRTVHPLPRSCPVHQFGFYDCIITVDHHLKQVIVTSSGLPEKILADRRRRARVRLEKLRERLQPAIAKVIPHAQPIRSELSAGSKIRLRLKSNFSKIGYSRAIKKVLEYIRQGDIYQVNLSQRFSIPTAGCHSQKAFDVYRALRRISPSSFGAYYDGGDFQIVSSSPESFLRLRRGVVQTRPMKGTRPRGRSLAADRRYLKMLQNSPKERAELLMITDLERNDLGRVCEFGSVRVVKMRQIERYRQVYQATSTVEGRIRRGMDGFDVLAATLPGGSVTGCPKIRAMQVIRELEPGPRWIYTGSLGYISFTGDMDMNILIRTLVVTPQEISFHTGGGIVADSVPGAEYEETLIKAKAMQAALNEVFL